MGAGVQHGQDAALTPTCMSPHARKRISDEKLEQRSPADRKRLLKAREHKLAMRLAKKAKKEESLTKTKIKP